MLCAVLKKDKNKIVDGDVIKAASSYLAGLYFWFALILIKILIICLPGFARAVVQFATSFSPI